MPFGRSALMNTIALIPRYAIYALLVFAPLARGGVQPWAATVIQMITVVALAAFLFTRTWKGRFYWIKTPQDKPILLLVAVCLISSAFSVHKPTSLRSLVLLLNYLILFYLTIHSFRTRKDILHLVYVIIGVAFLLSLFGLFKFFGANPFPWWDYTDLGNSAPRLSSTYGNANHLAGYMEMALPLLLGLLLLGYTRSKMHLLLTITGMALTALILSLSRGAWVGVTTGLTFMAACLFVDRRFHRKRLLIGIAGTTVFAVFVLLSTATVTERIMETAEKDTETNLHSRILGWKGTLNMIRENPFTGTGPGTYAQTITQYQVPGLGKHRTMAHNDYLQAIAENGIGIIPVIIISATSLFFNGFRKLKSRSRLVRGITIGALASLTALIVHSFVDFNLYIPANFILFTIIIAVISSPLQYFQR